MKSSKKYLSVALALVFALTVIPANAPSASAVVITVNNLNDLAWQILQVRNDIRIAPGSIITSDIDSITLQSGRTLTVSDGAELIFDADTSLLSLGTIVVESGGKITVKEGASFFSGSQAPTTVQSFVNNNGVISIEGNFLSTYMSTVTNTGIININNNSVARVMSDSVLHNTHSGFIGITGTIIMDLDRNASIVNDGLIQNTETGSIESVKPVTIGGSGYLVNYATVGTNISSRLAYHFTNSVSSTTGLELPGSNVSASDSVNEISSNNTHYPGTPPAGLAYNILWINFDDVTQTDSEILVTATHPGYNPGFFTINFDADTKRIDVPNYDFKLVKYSNPTPHNNSSQIVAVEQQLTVTNNGVVVNCTIDNGVCTINPSAQQWAQIMNNAVNGNVEIVLTNPATSVVISGYTSDLQISNIKLKMGSFGITKSMLDVAAAQAETGDKLYLTLTEGSLSVEIKIGAKALDWYSAEDSSTISIPYTPAEGILKDNIVVCRIDADGTKTIIPRSWFKESSAFAKIYEFGKYEAGISTPKTFTDLDEWMKESVDYCSARGVIMGVSEDTFNPQGTLTRAQFVTMLMRTLGIKLTDMPDSTGYSDESDIPQWALDSVLMAVKLEAIPDIFEGAFKPADPITREDMFTITRNVMTELNIKSSVEGEKEVNFDDADSISEFAGDAVTDLAKNGLVQGSNNLADPRGESTRAEAAQFIYNILKFEQN